MVAKTFDSLSLESHKAIASNASLASLNNLLLVSKSSYKLFNPILYEEISEPKYVGKLLMTLVVPPTRRRALGPHPASLVHTLRLQYFIRTPDYSTRPEEKEKIENLRKSAGQLVVSAINNTARVADGRSNLRAFHWYSNVAIEELGQVFLQRRQFPHLKELTFLTVSGLEYLEYKEQVDEHHLKEPVALSGFSTALRTIPVASPHLHTLKLDFEGWFGGVSRQDMLSSQRGPNSLTSIINSLRFPSLRIVSIRVNLIELNDHSDFRPFLNAHPSLADVSIDLGNRILAPTALPGLRSFEGRPLDCVSVCDGQRPLESLTLSLRKPRFDLSFKIKGVLYDKIVLQRLASTKTLRRLYLRAENSHPDEDPELESQCLCPSLIAQISTACPMLTHLELHVEDGILWCSQALRELKHLKWLRLNIWTRVEFDRFALMMKAMEYDYLDDIEYLDDIPRTAREVFPADKLARDIERDLSGALEQLHVVELSIAGDDDPRNEYKDHDGPDYEIEYVFEIIRDSRGVHAVLSETRDL